MLSLLKTVWLNYSIIPSDRGLFKALPSHRQNTSIVQSERDVGFVIGYLSIPPVPLWRSIQSQNRLQFTKMASQFSWARRSSGQMARTITTFKSSIVQVYNTETRMLSPAAHARSRNGGWCSSNAIFLTYLQKKFTLCSSRIQTSSNSPSGCIHIPITQAASWKCLFQDTLVSETASLLCEDILFWSWKDIPVGGAQPRLQLVLPPYSMVSKVLEGLHSSPTGAHLGVVMTLGKAQAWFDWPGQKKYVEDGVLAKGR